MTLREFQLGMPATEILHRQGLDNIRNKELKTARDRAERMAKSKGRRR